MVSEHGAGSNRLYGCCGLPSAVTSTMLPSGCRESTPARLRFFRIFFSNPSMIEPRQFSISPTLTFDALAAGADGAPLVLLLHGFAESMHCWRAQLEALGDAGYRALAPSQRGYSPLARPDVREAAHYHI